MFKVLELGDTKWPAAVMGLGPERRDIHFDQRMLAPYVAAYKWKAFLAFTEDENGYIVEPVLLTPEGYLKHAYNFGGPMGSSDLLSAREHTESLSEWAMQRGVTSQYCTLTPSVINSQLRLLDSSGIEPEYKKQSIVVDLDDQKIRGTTRRMANKAHAAGVLVKPYNTESHLETFYKMYVATMERVKAKDYWNFPFNWFQAFSRLVKPQLLIAEIGSVPESACLIVYSQQYPVAYYHFAGTFNKFPSLGINHMLVLAACEFVKSVGVRYLYLGGGITDSEDDGLFVFKSGFSKDRVPVYTFQRTYIVEPTQTSELKV